MLFESPAAVDAYLADAFAAAIRNTREVVAAREAVGHRMNVVERTGVFCTCLRTQLSSQEDRSTVFHRLAAQLSKTSSWSDVACPLPFNWDFSMETLSGKWDMSYAWLDALIRRSVPEASPPGEVADLLAAMGRSLLAAKEFSRRAQQINQEADVIVENLCTVAESLK